MEKILGYPYLQHQTKKRLQNEIKRLKSFDNISPNIIYHPIRELSIESEVAQLLKPSLSSILSEELWTKVEDIITKWKNIPLKTEKGKPPQFFFKTLQIVIFKILNEYSGMTKEKAKKCAAEIINEHFDRFPLYLKPVHSKVQEIEDNLKKDLSFCELEAKDIDNALHST